MASKPTASKTWRRLKRPKSVAENDQRRHIPRRYRGRLASPDSRLIQAVTQNHAYLKGRALTCRHCFRGRALGSVISTFSSPPHHAWLSIHLTLMMSRKAQSLSSGRKKPPGSSIISCCLWSRFHLRRPSNGRRSMRLREILNGFMSNMRERKNRPSQRREVKHAVKKSAAKKSAVKKKAPVAKQTAAKRPKRPAKKAS